MIRHDFAAATFFFLGAELVRVSAVFDCSSTFASAAATGSDFFGADPDVPPLGVPPFFRAFLVVAMFFSYCVRSRRGATNDRV
jgi:hypothetical protein